jgi:parvulin-like peptidyl-prolyl isomerase
MMFRILFVSLFTFSAFAQQASDPKPDTVLAIVDGHKVTFGEVDSYYKGIGPEARKNAFADLPHMIEQYALSLRLLDFAKNEKLEDKSPYKEAIASSRTMVLIQAALNEGSLKAIVPPDEQRKFYDSNKDRYTDAKVQVIYLTFVADPQASAKANPDKKYRSEDEAKAKIEEIRTQAKTRADFVRLVKEYSEDETSKNNDGDFGVIRKADNVPPEIKQVIFSLKVGDVSGPVRQQNGFYLFRVDETQVEDYAAVKDSIYNELQNQKARAWVEGLRSRPIEIVDKEFFGNKTVKP